MLDVIRMHRDSMRGIKPEHVQPELFLAAQESWDTALAHGEKFGYKNSQVTVLAPTGTIGFMMDCDTTGIEPDLALVKYKKLVGGGVIKIVNNTVPQALMKLGYTPEQTSEIVSHIDKNGKIEGAPYFKAEHLPVFDCSLAPAGGGRSITWTGHVKMMAAAQPFLSGAISKTINMPEESTIEDIMEAYIESWKLGLKAVAIYRDNSKRSQPLSAAGQKKDEKKTEPVAAVRGSHATGTVCPRSSAKKCRRSALPSLTNSALAATKATSPSGMYEDGRPGEIFIKMSKEGSTLSGVMDGLALTVSHRLAVRRAAEGLRRQAAQHALRAVGHHRESQDPLRFERAGLHRALAGRAFYFRGLSEAERRGHAGSRCSRGAPLRHPWCAQALAALPVSQRIVQAQQRARRRAYLLGVRHADGSERRVLQVRKLRQHQWLQLTLNCY